MKDVGIHLFSIFVVSLIIWGLVTWLNETTDVTTRWVIGVLILYFVGDVLYNFYKLSR
jgi:hypothetical protein